MEHGSQHAAIGVDWYRTLRWFAILGQFVAVIGGWAYGFALPLLAMCCVIAVELGVSVALALRPDTLRRNRGLLGFLLAMDAVCLTALLMLSGGPYNPFGTLYLVNVALAAVIMTPRAAWGLAVWSLALSALTFVVYDPLEMRQSEDSPIPIVVGHELGSQTQATQTPSSGVDEHAHHSMHDSSGEQGVVEHSPGAGTHDGHSDHASHDMDLHMRGMWVASALAAMFIVVFIRRIRAQLQEREDALVASRSEAARSERMAGLAGLAAGAAHELSTPLSTIAVASRELFLALNTVDTELAVDAQVIRSEVDRCLAILRKLSVDAGQPMAGRAGANERTSVGEILSAVIETLRPGDLDRLQVVNDCDLAEVALDKEVASQAVRNLVDNALLAGPGQVRLSARLDSGRAYIEVVDRGVGMSDVTRLRAGDPFFTTRTEGEGMGLGVFVARSVAEQVGGQMHITSTPNEGTTVVIELPVLEGVLT